MADIKDVLAKVEDEAYHRVATAKIFAVPQALRDEHAELEALFPTLVSDTIDAHPDAQPTADRLLAIEAEFEAATIEFRFRSIGHKAWADLLRAHPPTKDQLKDDRALEMNPETFPYAAMAASCIDPVMSIADVERLDASPVIDVRAWNELWAACIKANVAASNPKSLAASIHQASVASSPRRKSTKSRGRSSSGE